MTKMLRGKKADKKGKDTKSSGIKIKTFDFFFFFKTFLGNLM